MALRRRRTASASHAPGRQVSAHRVRMNRAPRDLDEEPLRPGEFPIEGDWGVSVLGDEAIDLPPDYKNGQWGFSGPATGWRRGLTWAAIMPLLIDYRDGRRW